MTRKHQSPMPYLIPQPRCVRIVPCITHPGCFRWIISSADGLHVEQSSYSYASSEGARAIGNMRLLDLAAKR